jgi:hypothetical protein
VSKGKIEVPFSGPIDRILDRAAREAAASGVRFSGNSKVGRMENSDFRLSYEVHERTIVFTIEDKPFYIPASMIEAKIKDWLA